MATFSTNQVRHLYVANAVKNSVAASDAKGSIALKSDNAKTHIYFSYKGADTLMRSDLIDVKNILSAKVTDAKNMAHKLKSVTVTRNKSISEDPIAGQDYILRIAIRQYIGISDEDVYFKYGMVHAYAGMDDSKFYKTLALSLVKNFSRETTKLFKFTLTKTGNVAVPVDETTREEDLTDTYEALVIDEVEQPWRRGIMEQVPVYFEVQPTTITAYGDEVVWGDVEDTESEATIGNGKKIADLEYFCMGERGDIYRNVGWPNSIPTEYLVDPTKEYHTFDIHYAYVGANEGVQKSEKDITIVCSDKTELNKLVTAFNTATGLNIKSLS